MTYLSNSSLLIKYRLRIVIFLKCLSIKCPKAKIAWIPDTTTFNSILYLFDILSMIYYILA